MAEALTRQQLLALTTDIVVQYVTSNTINHAQLPELIAQTYRALAAIGAGETAADAEAPKPAVPIRKSVTRDHIVCLEDGRKLTTLKRHLAMAHNMTPDAYRAKWQLPPNYPMVAPDYADQRSALAKASGLGKPAQKRRRKAREKAKSRV